MFQLWKTFAAAICSAAILCSPAAAADQNRRANDSKRPLRIWKRRCRSRPPITRRSKKAALARKLPSLRVCGDPGNLPLSDINRAGYQNKIIELVAAEMGTSVTYFWRPYLERGITRQTFESGDCDVLLDLPIGFERVLTTEPIYRTTYVLAYRNDRGLDIDEPRRSEAARTLSHRHLPDLRPARGPGHARHPARTSRLHVLSHNADLNPENQPYKQVEQVVQGKLDVAGVWGPFAGWMKVAGRAAHRRSRSTCGKTKSRSSSISPSACSKIRLGAEVQVRPGARSAQGGHRQDPARLRRAAGAVQPLLRAGRSAVARHLHEADAGRGIDNAQDPRRRPTRRSPGNGSKDWLKDGADLNQELSNAVLAGDVARIAFLIEKGADVNKRDAQGYTAAADRGPPPACRADLRPARLQGRRQSSRCRRLSRPCIMPCCAIIAESRDGAGPRGADLSATPFPNGLYAARGRHHRGSVQVRHGADRSRRRVDTRRRR